MTEIDDDTNGKIYHAHGLENLILLKCSSNQSNLQIRGNPYQNASSIFHRTRTNNPKIYIEPQKTPNSQSELEKEQTGGITIPDFKIY